MKMMFLILRILWAVFLSCNVSIDREIIGAGSVPLSYNQSSKLSRTH